MKAGSSVSMKSALRRVKLPCLAFIAFHFIYLEAIMAPFKSLKSLRRGFLWTLASAHCSSLHCTLQQKLWTEMKWLSGLQQLIQDWMGGRGLDTPDNRLQILREWNKQKDPCKGRAHSAKRQTRGAKDWWMEADGSFQTWAPLVKWRIFSMGRDGAIKRTNWLLSNAHKACFVDPKLFKQLHETGRN